MIIKKLSKLLFYSLIFLIPSNLAKHWPQNWSYVNGILIDYLIPTLYLTDILIGMLLLCWLAEYLVNNFQFFRPRRTSPGLAIFNFQSILNDSIFKNLNIKNSLKIKNFKLKIVAIMIFLLFAVYSLLFAKNPPAALYKLIKLIEFSLLILWIKTHINIKKDIVTIVNVLSFSVIWQSVLAIAQWLKQGSIFGYWFLGEQPYSSANLGIKFINFFGHLKIPPYGTFPHPNVLAGFLAVSLTLIIFNFSAHGEPAQGWQFSIFNQFSISKFSKLLTSHFLLLTSLLLGSIALFLTFSYPAWLAWLWIMGHGLWIMGKRLLKNVHYSSSIIHHPLFIIHLSIYSLLIATILFFWFQTNEPTSLTRRFDLTLIAFRLWLSSPVFGVGLNNFIPRMEEFGSVVSNTRFLQPVHNIYLLWLSETGVIGLIWPIWLIRQILKKKTYSTSLYFSVLLCTLWLGFFDHYFLTLQQGQLLLALLFGLLLASSIPPYRY